MLIRIVRMTFHPEKTTDFLTLFDRVSNKIRSAEGCRHLELWRDRRFPNVMSTYSVWEDRDALERYRSSLLFKETWKDTKTLFAGPPAAQSYEMIRGQVQEID